MAIERLRVPVGDGFDPTNPAHVDLVLQKVAQAGEGAGWTVQSYDPQTGQATLSRRGAVTTVTRRDLPGQDSYEVGLGGGVRVSDGDKIAAELESDPQHAGFFVTRFDPYLGRATMSRLADAERRCRAAVATVLRVKPWDVQVHATGQGGFDLDLPGGYVPSRFDDKLQEVAESIVGRPGWYFTADARTLTGRIVPSTPPTFPAAISYTPRLLPEPGSDRIPLGERLAERGDQPNDVLSLSFTNGPHVQLAGTTGAGKLLTLGTPLPTPTGWTTMGQIRLGDRVLGRDGKPCTVTAVSAVNPTPDMYEVRLSDGQVIKADADHQWVVSSHTSRATGRGQHRRAAVERRDALVAQAAALDERSRQSSGTVSLAELARIVRLEAHCDVWTTLDGLRQALKFMGVPVWRERRERTYRPRAGYTDVVKMRGYRAPSVLRALATHWDGPVVTGRRGSRAPVRANREGAERAVTARLVSRRLGNRTVTVPELVDAFAAADPDAPKLSSKILGRYLRDMNVASVQVERARAHPPQAAYTTRAAVNVYDARHALRALGARVAFLASEEKTLEPSERIMTTAELLAEWNAGSSGAGWAIRLAGPLRLPEARLPVAPYTFGAWLGDGTARTGAITSMDPEIVEDIAADGYTLSRVEGKPGNRASTYFFNGLWQQLRATLEADVQSDGRRKLRKRIPLALLRASYRQRLAVLQGLMDTDGTISASGGCEISLNDRDLAYDVLELVRTLGIRASCTESPSSYVDADGSKRVTGTRYRTNFTTTLPVFRLPRKLARIPSEPRAGREFLYMTSIRPTTPEPGRCIQVDSPDSTYLAAGFVPTHNTVTLNVIIAGALAAGMELAVVDVPAKGVDFDAWHPFVRDGGWGCESYEEDAVCLEQLYREGERRAGVFKRYGVKKLADLPADVRRTMPQVLIVVDEVTGLFTMDAVPKRLDQDDPLRVEAEQHNYARELIKTFIEKIVAEMRYVGYHLVLSTQVASVNTGVSTALRTNLSHKLLLGASATDGNRKLVLTDVTRVPVVPDVIRQDADASLGVGVAELAGQPAAVFKSFYASEQDIARMLTARGVTSRDRQQLDATRPDPKAVHARFPDLAVLGQAQRDQAAPPFDDRDRPPEAWELDPATGERLSGFARANAARHQVTAAAAQAG